MIVASPLILMLLDTQPTPRTAEIAALNEFRIASGSINGADGTFSFTQRYSDGTDTVWTGRLMRLENVEDPSTDDPVSSQPEKWRVPSQTKVWQTSSFARFVVAQHSFDGYSELTSPKRRCE